jgi:peptide/nickel transport system substrate-binding protein
VNEGKGYWQSRSSRLPRRRVLQGAALGSAGLTAAALIGCGPGERSEAPSGAEQVKQPKRGGTLSRRFVSTVFGGNNLDPHIQQSSQTGLMGLFYQQLVKLNPRTQEIEPHLAQKWESPAETTLVFTLQNGVKWHDKPPVNGREMTAQDVIFSIERLRTNQPAFINRSLFASIDKLEAPDKSTVRLTMSQPDVTVLGNVGAYSAAIMTPEIVEKVGSGKFTTVDTAIGTGAFVITGMDDVSATLVRHPNYWKSGMPYLDGVRIQLINGDDAAYAAFLAKQLDIAYVPGNEAKKVVDDKNRDFGAEFYADVSVQGVYMNTQRKPFDDVRVTRALRLLIDHQEALTAWAETWFGRGYMSAALPASLEPWDFTQEEYATKYLQWKRPKDEAAREAVRLLNAAGFTRENPFKFILNGYRDTDWGRSQTELLQAQYKRLGQGIVDPELGLMDQPTITSSLARGEFNFMMSGQVPPQPFDPDGYLRDFYHSKGGRNYGKFNDPKADAVIDKQKTVFNLQQRKAAVKEAMLYLMDNAANSPWSGRYQSNVWHKHVQDYAPEANSSNWGHNYERVWFDT